MNNAALFYCDLAPKPEWFARLGSSESEFVLCMLHRAESADDLERLSGILKGIAESGLSVILPLHPCTRGVMEFARIVVANNVRLGPPVGY